MKPGLKVPEILFKMRAGDMVEDPGMGGCPVGGVWITKTSNDIFANKRCIVFSLPGAFTPTCSTQQLPGFEENADTFEELGIQDIYCISVNDAFVMNAWAEALNIHRIQVIPDGNGDFTRQMGMLVKKEGEGFGQRSWRYAMIVNDGKVEAFFEEPGRTDNAAGDPYGETSPENLLGYLSKKENQAA